MMWMAERPENGTKNKVLYDYYLRVLVDFEVITLLVSEGNSPGYDS
jgi:hypothetical protein